MLNIDFSDHIREPLKQSSNSHLFLILLLLLSLGGGAGYYFYSNSTTDQKELAKNSQVKKVETPKVTPLKKPEVTPKVVAEVPENVAPQTVDKSTLPAKIEKIVVPVGPEIPVNIASNNKTMDAFVSHLGQNSSGDMGFSNVVLKGSNYFYIRGLASNSKNFEKLKTNLNSVASKMEKPVVKSIGVAKKAVDFTLYGELKAAIYRTNPKAVASKDLMKEVKAIEQMFKKTTGIDFKIKKTVTESYQKSIGNYFEARVKLDFKKLESFLSAFSKKDHVVALEVLNLKAGEAEDLNAHFTFVVYSKK